MRIGDHAPLFGQCLGMIGGLLPCEVATISLCSNPDKDLGLVDLWSCADVNAQPHDVGVLWLGRRSLFSDKPLL